MPRVKTEKQFNAFVKGFITEAGPLTFPENASIDESNFVLNRDGSRSVRYGIDYETGYTLNNTSLTSANLESTRVQFHRWDYAGGGTISLGVVRVYNKLWFLNLNTANPSDNIMNGGSAVTLTALVNAPCDFTVVNQKLIVVSTDLDTPLLFEYDSDADSISYKSYAITIRDFFGVDDDLLINQRPTTLTTAHTYNLRNQGWTPQIQTTCGTTQDSSGVTRDATWDANLAALFGLTGTYILPNITATKKVVTNVGDAISCMYTDKSVYPSNADVWTYGKIAVTTDANFDKFKPDTLVKNSYDQGKAPLGSYVLGIYNRGAIREFATDLSGLPTDRETGRISTCTAYADRVFYSGIESKVFEGDDRSPNMTGFVFFSKTVTDDQALGICHQEADPTSENQFDIIDTDGGVVQITEANNIRKLISLNNSVVVMAENGVWEIYGGTSGFKATDYQVNKITNVGCVGVDNIVVAGTTILYFAKGGIYLLQTDSVSQRLVAQNISITTIQTFYNELSEVTKKYAKAVYDEKENLVRWMYNSSDSYLGTTYIDNYNKELVFDITLGAWYKNSIGTLTSGTPMICAYVTTPNFITSNVVLDVVVNGVQVQANTVDVTMTTETEATRRSTTSYLTLTLNSTYYFTISKYINTDFYDWYSVDSTGTPVNAFIITGQELFSDMMRKKQAPYILFYFKKTESAFDVNFDLIGQSSCLVQARWDWADSSNSGKWGTQFQAYRLTRMYIPASPMAFDYGYDVIVTKNKLRGSGRALSLYITNEAGKDMKLLGWALDISGNSAA